ncbi:cytochrome c biogenesis protein CcsA [Agromyces hippuratus]|uniref:cytochrome c biogenesis protein CcsA n=1 Tax=Agromyces hippuratus TaxID=286438 RepID=UPI0035E89B6A
MLAWILHLSATVLRGPRRRPVPWANMYEFALTGTLIITTVFLIVIVIVKQDLRFLGTFITGLVLVLLGVAALNFYVSPVPLPPALQSVWLVIHVFVASASVGLFALGFALSVVQLMQARRESIAATTAKAAKAHLPRDAARLGHAREPRVPHQHHRLHHVDLHPHGGLRLAEKAWGRYWGWDTKEVWTFIIWVVYAGYIHARATRAGGAPARRGSRSSASRRCSSTSPWSTSSSRACTRTRVSDPPEPSRVSTRSARGVPVRRARISLTRPSGTPA